MRTNLGNETLVFTVADPHAISTAVRGGIGIGFLADHEASHLADLIERVPPSKDWSVPIWVVTHIDLHRTDKVQRFLEKISNQPAHARDAGT